MSKWPGKASLKSDVIATDVDLLVQKIREKALGKEFGKKSLAHANEETETNTPHLVYESTSEENEMESATDESVLKLSPARLGSRRASLLTL